MDLNFWLSQAFGSVALIFVCISYFVRSRKTFLLLNVVANFLYSGAFLVEGLFVAGVDTLISIARTVGLFIFVKNEQKPPLHYLFVIISAYFINTSVFFAHPADLVVLTTSIMFSIAYFVNSLQWTRVIVILPNMALTAYNISFRLYASAILSAVETCVAITSVVKFQIDKKKQKRLQI